MTRLLMGTIRRMAATFPCESAAGDPREVSVQCSCGAVFLDEPVAADYTIREYARELCEAHCGATNHKQERRNK